MATTCDANAQASAGEKLEEVMVTGSRVLTNGNDSPTPVTVVTVDDLQASHPSTVFEALLDLPSFSGSRGGLSSNPGAAGNVNVAISTLNLRGLGTVRSLVLYDGHRVPATEQDGLVNANTIPQMLLQRVDIVTGGASAVYGSDAIGGVVNFVTDRNFTGSKLEAQTGLAERGDAGTYQVGAAFGTSLFDGRGHFQGSIETIHDDGVLNRNDRSQFLGRWTIQGAGTSALPFFLVANGTNSSYTFGGKITGSAGQPLNPLRNYQFSSNGVLTPFVNGSTVGIAPGSLVQIGGDGAYETGPSLKSRQDLNQVYGRFDFDLTDNLHYFLTASGTEDHTFNYYNNLNLQNLTMSASNAFLSPVYQQQMAAAGDQTFVFSKKFGSESLVPRTNADFYTRSLYINTGLEGQLGAYRWEASYTRSDAKLDSQANAGFDNGRLYAALDAVVNPATGQVVCQVSLTANAGRYPGCVPLNPFGPTSESQSAIDYVWRTADFLSKMPTDDISGSITGSPFNNWAGPVTVALSGEWRDQGFELISTAQPVNYAPLDCTGLRYNCVNATATNVGTASSSNSTANRPPISMTVSEAALEADVPLVKDLPLARSVDMNLAYRYAMYHGRGNSDPRTANTTSEFNTNAWKVGLTWDLNDEVTLRVARSRDVRAPNLFDLYQPNAITFAAGPQDLLTQQTLTGAGTLIETVNGGNPNLQPEVGSTTTVGMVFNPTPDLSVAIDAFDISVANYIFRINGFDTTVQNACYAGNAFFCTLHERPFPISNTTPANAVTRWYVRPSNIARLETRGVDLEVNYTSMLASHPFTFRGLLTYQPHVNFYLPNAPTQDFAGTFGGTGNTAAGGKVRLTLFAHYSPTENFGIDWRTRWRASEVAAGDPTLVSSPNTDLPSQSYSSLNLSYRFSNLPTGVADVYLNIQNVLDQSAHVSAQYGAAASPGQVGGFRLGDDPIGRYYTLGVRYRM
jgi:outer membrane receptor protein involved in Fe transport